MVNKYHRTYVSGKLGRSDDEKFIFFPLEMKYSKIQVLPGITSCRLMKDNNQQLI